MNKITISDRTAEFLRQIERSGDDPQRLARLLLDHSADFRRFLEETGRSEDPDARRLLDALQVLDSSRTAPTGDVSARWETTLPPPMNLTPLLHKSLQLFDRDEYRMLCIALGVPYENIVTPQGTIAEAAGRLMAFCERRGTNRSLMDLVASERPRHPFVQELEHARLERPARGMIVVATPDLPITLIKNVLGGFRAELVDPPLGTHEDLGRYLNRIRDFTSGAAACVAILGQTAAPAHVHATLTHLEAVCLAAFFTKLPCWIATEETEHPTTTSQVALLSLVTEVGAGRMFKYQRDDDGMDLVRVLQQCLTEVQEQLFN